MANYLLLAGLGLLYCAGTAIYRLYLSPLAHVPGPRIAALTSWYCAYHDMIRGGRYTHVVESMHQKYGPIVRIMPGVLHVNDPSFVDELYPAQSPSQPRERPWTILNLFVDHYSSMATGPHDLHRRRRAVLSKFFSQRNVRALMGVINTTLADLLTRMEAVAQGEEGEGVLTMSPALRAATKDVIQLYAFGDGDKCLDAEDFNDAMFRVLSPERAVHVGVHLHWLPQAMSKLPENVLKKIDPHLIAFIDWLKVLEKQIKSIQNAKDAPEGRTIFHEIMNSNLSEDDKSPKRLLDEAMVLAIAGADTTASTLAALVYHILADPAVFHRLRAELDSVMPDVNEPPNPVALDGLPYLNALIEEALRLYPGVTHRLDRSAPVENLVFTYPESHKAIVIPRGTPVGMSARILNRHPALYGPDADVFRPERYLEDPKLAKKSMTFCKGGRQCLGVNLAYQELQTFTAGIFRKFGRFDPSGDEKAGSAGEMTLELFETTIEDVQIYSDYVTPRAYPGSQGVRLRVRASSS